MIISGFCMLNVLFYDMFARQASSHCSNLDQNAVRKLIKQSPDAETH